RPGDVIDIRAQIPIIEGFPVSHIKLRELFRLQVIDHQIHREIRLADLWICFDLKRVVETQLIQQHEIFLYVLLLKFVESNLFAVRRPPHSGVLTEFLSIYPSGYAVFDLRLLVAVGCQSDYVGSVRLAKVHITVLSESFESPIRRHSRVKLPTAGGPTGSSSFHL